MSGGCSLALKISVTFCERVKRRRKREKNPFLETHVRAGRGRRSSTLKSQDWSPGCSCLGSTASLKDALKGMPGQRYSGIWVFEVFSCIWYPKSSLQPGWWADQDEMLLCNKPQAEFLPAVALWMSSELHQGQDLVSGDMLLKACAGQNNSENNLFLTPHTRGNQCCFSISADLTESCCCVVGRIWDGCSEKTVSTQNLLRVGHTWSRCLIPYWAACPWQGQHNIVCRSS